MTAPLTVLRSGVVATPQQTLPQPTPMPPRSVAGDPGELSPGGFSLAAALGATLLGVVGDQSGAERR
ncbi:hypothetical protein [Brachybacterium tyrofermentans]|uniref:hypothetical protein n=1 Tax=Brachybacterium tyrofermentans TaxID=47848 RepID=UPI003FD44A07